MWSHAWPSAKAASTAATSPSRAQRATTVAPGTNAAIWRRSFRRPVTALTIRPSKSKAMLKTGTRELVTLLGCRDPPPAHSPSFWSSKGTDKTTRRLYGAYGRVSGRVSGPKQPTTYIHEVNEEHTHIFTRVTITRDEWECACARRLSSDPPSTAQGGTLRPISWALPLAQAGAGPPHQHHVTNFK